MSDRMPNDEFRMTAEPGRAAPMAPRHRNSSLHSSFDTRRSTFSRGFSLVEILVVIGIIAVLITLAVVGFKTVGRIMREKFTNNQMENCKSLLAEYELTSTLDTLISPAPVATNHWVAPAAGTPTSLNCTIAAVPGAYTPAAEGSSDATHDALVQDTARIVARLHAVPKNRESLEKMPTDHIHAEPFASVTTALGTLPAGQTAILLDGSGYPIIFVPGGGLTGVNLAYKGSGDPTVAANYNQANQTVRSPDGRPFWVSPGPDGDLSTGDDNIYSFGK